MTPELALSLSHEGIILLRQTATGWERVDSADPTDPALELRLNELRARATEISPDGLHCRIILPENQIRYLDIPFLPGEVPEQDAACAALEGQTPYAVDDLTLATAISGDRLFIAAVARETLEEAETFARDHGFEPVEFSASPTGDLFPGTPFFGSRATSPAEQTAPTGSLAREIPAPRHSGFAEEPEVFVHQADPPARVQRPPAQVRSLEAHQASKIEAFGDKHRGEQKASLLLRPATLGFLTVILAVGTGIWASGLIGTGGVTAFLGTLDPDEPEAQFAAPLQPEDPAPVRSGTAPQSTAEEWQPAAANGTDAAIREALSVPVAPEVPETPQEPVDDLARYAATGIWSSAPDVPSPPALVDLENLYVTSIDPIQVAFDAVALPDTVAVSDDIVLLAPASPAPAGTAFVLDDRGFVVPTATGAMNPDGILIFAGTPPVRPPQGRVQVIGEASVADPVLQALLAGFRPRLRPGDLVEQSERASFSGLTRAELAAFRPAARPQSLQEQAAALTAAASATAAAPRSGTAGSLFSDTGAAGVPDNAVAVSLRPETRPSDFSITVARTLQNAPAAAPPATVTTASAAPRAVAPRIPSSASAAREATEKNAINLRRVNLIGVYGKPSDRRALIRLGNGRYKKVQVGDRLDGGRVSAIGDAELRYQKSGRNIVLKMPSS
ncbi:hypothetical protein [uncultured Roseobacter sp.]|uniref:hypothetical protein n=1 Tax=uncultured Roseobacter sp. TaxID=114847 RepID=UPI00261B47AA|nr:hypothetical protein [uncultured Roseobacter sp.]